MKKKYFFIVFTLLFTASLSAQISDDLWSKSSKKEKKPFKKVGRETLPNEFEIYQLNLELLKEKLVAAPLRKTNVGKSNTIISFPNEKGVLEKYKIFEASVMEEDLQQKFPAIKSYIGKGIDNSNATIRFSITTMGLNATILYNSGSASSIDVYTADKRSYMVFSNKNLPEKAPFECGFEDANISYKEQDFKATIKNANDSNLRTYRVAIATNGEYSQYQLELQGVEATASDQVKKEAVLSAIVSTISANNAILERDLGLTLVIVGQNLDIIYLDPESDPFDSYEDQFSIMAESEPVINNVIGIENFDIGHAFIGEYVLGGAGKFASVCSSGKAGGISCLDSPGLKWIVLHEMGHQFGASHTFNNCRIGNSPFTSVEPGCGARTGSLMTYSSDINFYYHMASILEIWNSIYINEVDCGSLSETNNSPPILEEVPNYSIPNSTPFRLEANASDTNGDDLTYTFQQLDPEQAVIPLISTSTVGPAFAALPPSIDPRRYFPNLKTVLEGNISNEWEVIPTVARSMNFGIMVRDNNPNVGQSASTQTTITFTDNQTPFQVASQDILTEWEIGSTQTVTWDLGGSDKSPVNCSLVNILFSIDDGSSFPIVLASRVPNDGEHQIVVPDVSTSGGRIKIEGVDNIFYAVNKGFIATNIEQKTEIPDENFEQALIDLGYDDKIDNYVLTYVIERITEIDISGLNIKQLNGLEDFKRLNKLICSSNNDLEGLNVTQNKQLTHLECHASNLESLDVSENSELTYLWCGGNSFTSLDLSKNKQLTNLNLQQSVLDKIDLSNNIELLELSMTWMNFATVDLSKNIKLLNLAVGYSSIESLDLSNNKNLLIVQGRHLDLKSLDLSHNEKLIAIILYSGNLESLNIKNGNNSSITNFNVSDNPELKCIQVDNEVDANSNIDNYANWEKDETASYSENCGYALGVDDELLANGLKFYPNPVSNSLTIESQIPIEKVEVYTILGQKVIEKSSDLGAVSTETLSKGIYMLKIFSENGCATKRLIKQ